MSDSFFQNSFYIGNNFNWILYGVELVLYTQTMRIYRTSKSTSKTSSRFFICFTTALLFLTTIFVTVQSVFGEEMWIVNANYPGGPAAYLQDHAAVWYETMGTTSSVILQLMSDGLLVYRCFVVWQDRRIVVLPCILWLASLAFGILDLYASGSPNSDFWAQGFPAHIGVTYIATSIGLNALVTSLICGRILYSAHSMKKEFGPALAKTYFNSAAIIIESALPYTLCGIAFVVSYGLNSPISVFFLSLYCMFMCLSPQMLVLRVASGRAWSVETATCTKGGTRSIRFQKRKLPGTVTTSTIIQLDDDLKVTEWSQMSGSQMSESQV